MKDGSEITLAAPVAVLVTESASRNHESLIFLRHSPVTPKPGAGGSLVLRHYYGIEK
jgi:hypothetical protein